jgi:hypothetical protein
MMTTLKARWRTTRPTASRALQGGTLAAALLVIILLVAFRACAP